MARRAWWVAGAVALLCVALLLALRDADRGSTARREDVGVDGGVLGAMPTAATRGGAHPRRVEDVHVGALQLEGLVVDAEDRPVAGARVRVTPGKRGATSKADGSFAIDGLTAGRYYVDADTAELYAPTAAVQLTASSEPVTLRLVPAMPIAVHVSDAEAHAAIAGAKVALDDDERTWLADAAGIARVTGVAPQQLSLHVSAAGYAPRDIWFSSLDQVGPLLELRVALARGALLSGIVRGPDNAPVADAHVRVSLIDKAWGRSAEATSDASGAWQIDALAAGRYVATAQSAVFAPVLPSAFDLDGSTPRRDLVVRVSTGASCTGTVVGRDGTPIKDAEVHVTRHARLEDASTKTDAKGRFVIGGLTDGVYDVLAFADDHGNQVVRHVEVKSGTPCAVAVAFDDDDIAGTVVDSAGTPVAGARVVADRAEYDVTDATGHFALHGLKAGDHALWAHLDRAETAPPSETTKAPAGAHDVRLVARRPATLTGRVLIDGAPAHVFGIGSPDRGAAITFHTSDGRFETTALPAGTWKLLVAATGAQQTTRDHVELVAGQTLDLGDITLVRGRHLSGHVHDPSGRAVGGARVILGNDDEVDAMPNVFSSGAVTLTDPSGFYAFDGIDGLERSVYATRADLGRTAYEHIGDGAETVDLTFRVTGGIDGVVDGFTGEAMALDIVGFDVAGWEYTSVDQTGAFHIDVPPGTYRIQQDVYDSDVMAIGPETVTVVANQRSSVHVGFPTQTIRAVVVGNPNTRANIQRSDGGPRIAIVELDANGSGQATLAPGDYTLCGNDRCVPITVAPSPAVQTFDVPAAAAPAP